jgi:hypothetical protein
MLIPLISVFLREAKIIVILIEDMEMQIAFISISLAALTLINHAPEPTTLLVKLQGIGLLTVTMVLNTLVVLFTPLIRDAYQPPIISSRRASSDFVLCPLPPGRIPCKRLTESKIGPRAALLVFLFP